MTFEALVIDSTEPRVSIRSLTQDQLPGEGDVLVGVEWSSINYKDALAVTSKGKIIRGEMPFVPGIDLAGSVIHSESSDFSEGDRVLATGWGIGEKHWGGYSQVQRVSSKSLIPIPSGLSTRDSMIVGTAGLTAMLSVLEIENHGLPITSGEVLVTGATGGVGSFSTMLLSQAGYQVAASTGKSSARDYLMSLGATRIVERSELENGAARPLDRGEWSGCIDSVGSKTLESVLSRCKAHAVVAACGLAGGHELNTTVFPFILRGVKLIGIDSNTCPVARRITAWSRLSELAGNVDLNSLAHEVALSGIVEASTQLMKGGITGRYVVNLQSGA